MKCVKCGAQLFEGDQFCHKCGAKAPISTPEIQFCRKCGTQLDEESNYCPKCGAKVLLTKDDSLEQCEQINEHDSNTDNSTATPTSNVEADVSQLTPIQKIKQQAINFWNTLDLFSKCSAVSLPIGMLLLLISICASKASAGFCSILQISFALIAIFMHKGIISVKQRWAKYILLFLTIPLIFLNIKCYASSKKQPVKPSPQAVQETSVSPLPESTETTEATETTKTLETTEATQPASTNSATPSHSVVVPGNYSKFYREPLKNVEAAFKAAGFSNIHVQEKVGSDSNCLDTVDVVDSVTIDGLNAFEDGQIFLDDAQVVISYLKAQEEKNIVNLYIDFEKNIFFSTYDVTLAIDDYSLGILPHGTSKKFELNLDAGSYTLKANRVDNPAIGGSIAINISETSDITIQMFCHSDSIALTQTYYESKRELQDNEARVPQSANSYKGKLYSDVVAELKNAGFSEINTFAFHDITGAWPDSKEGAIKSISIGGKPDFIKSEVFLKDAPIIIQYHANAYTQQEMQEKILANVKQPANVILSYFSETPCSVDCYILGKKIDSFTPDGYFLESGTVSDGGKKVVLNFTTPELTTMKETLEKNFPKDMAIRVVVTAMTNGQATDVFMADGMTYNTQKFHKYCDISGFYLYPYEIGTWIIISENTWRVEDMKCMLSGYTTAINVSANITFDGSNYELSNVDKVIAGKEIIDSGKTDEFITEHYATPDNAPFLTVQPYLVNEERNAEAEKERNNRTMPTDTRKKWINNQFSWFSGRHEQFEKIIKRQLNDEKSFKVSETTYISIVNEEILKEVNTALQNSGYSNRCKIGDLFLMCKFTAKNAFNATIKNTALGISSYDSNTITLIGIE